MCIYARTVFVCNHQQWGRRVKLCPDAEASRPCEVRKPHGLHSRRVINLCRKCQGLNAKCALVRAKLEECQATFHKAFPDYVEQEAAGVNVKCDLVRAKLKECQAAFHKAFPDYVQQEPAEPVDEANAEAIG